MNFKKIKIFFSISSAAFIGCCYLLLPGCDPYAEDLDPKAYPCTINVCDSLGVPAGKGIFYFLLHTDLAIDSMTDRYHSSILRAFHEPVLDNHYLSNDMFRLTILASWQPAKIIKFIKSGSNTIVIIKTFDKRYDFFPVDNINKTGIDVNTGKPLKPRDTLFTYSFRKVIIRDEWDYITKNVEAGKFWRMDDMINDNGPDGTSVILEGHTKKRYWFVSRWQPSAFNKQEEFKKLCDDLAKLAGEKINWNN